MSEVDKMKTEIEQLKINVDDYKYDPSNFIVLQTASIIGI